MTNIEDSLKDTIASMNNQISDTARETKLNLFGTVDGTPVLTYSLVGLTIIVISAMVFRKGVETEEEPQEEPQQEQPQEEEQPEENTMMGSFMSSEEPPQDDEQKEEETPESSMMGSFMGSEEPPQNNEQPQNEEQPPDSMETQEDTSPPPEGEGEPKENQQGGKKTKKNNIVDHISRVSKALARRFDGLLEQCW